MALVAKGKKKKKALLLRGMQRIRTFEMGGVPRGANGESSWVVCKEDGTMKLDLTKINGAIASLTQVATVLKSGEPTTAVQQALRDKLAETLNSLALQGVALDGIDRDSLKENLEKINARVTSVASRERDMALADEIEEMQATITDMVQQLSDDALEAAKKKGKSEPAAESPPPADVPAPTADDKPAGAPTDAPVPAPAPAAEPTPAPTPAPTPTGAPGTTVTGDAPQPETPPPPAATQSPVADPAPENEELVSKADLKGFIEQLTGQISKMGETLGGVVNKLQQDVTTLQQGMTTVNKTLDPGSYPGLVTPPAAAPEQSDEEDFPSNMNSLADKISNDDLGLDGLGGLGL